MIKTCIFLDVFADAPFAGNQLAVFPNADKLTAEQMQKLANEINYSETTFILDSDDPAADFEMRIFSKRFELPFSGHPTLGTAYAIMNLADIWQEGRDSVNLKTKVGVIPLARTGETIWMRQNEPEFRAQHTDKEEIAALIGLSPEEIADDLPVEEVSTGNNMLIIPVKSLAAVQRANGNASNLRDSYVSKNSIGPYLFTLETVNPKASVHTRFFAPHLGVMEDAATGSAAGPLTAYLLKYNVFGKSFEIENEQGIEMGRPSRILMKGDVKDNKYTIYIGGKCAYVGRGEFVLDELEHIAEELERGQK